MLLRIASAPRSTRRRRQRKTPNGAALNCTWSRCCAIFSPTRHCWAGRPTSVSEVEVSSGALRNGDRRFGPALPHQLIPALHVFIESQAIGRMAPSQRRHRKWNTAERVRLFRHDAAMQRMVARPAQWPFGSREIVGRLGCRNRVLREPERAYEPGISWNIGGEGWTGRRHNPFSGGGGEKGGR